MNVIKRNGKEVKFDLNKIKQALKKANNSTEELTEDEINDITNKALTKCLKYKRAVSVEEIQDIVEDCLIQLRAYKTSKHYIKYRYQKELDRKQNTIDTQVLTTVNLENEEVKQENSNKNPIIIPTQRDYIAGLVSKDITNRYLLPKDITEAHKKGIIHFHDADYYVQKLHNCDVYNLDDMLQNGTTMNGTKIDKPHSFLTACTVATQIMALVASSQYGGQTITLSHLAPFVDISRKKIRKEVEDELLGINHTSYDVDIITEKRLKEEIEKGVQTIQYQILTISSTNGQTPFVSLFMYLNEVEDEQTKSDLALIIEEVLKQRIQGIKNRAGIWITPAFPKLLYVLEEDNITEDSKYWYLTQLAAKCNSKRMVPDYISEKVMKRDKINSHGEGDCYPCMGAARGDETVTIKVSGETFENIPIKQAFQIVKLYTRNQLSIGNPIVSKFKGLIGVYKITHLPTGNYYVGSSKDISRRWREHTSNIRHQGSLGDFHPINDFNINNYRFDVLESCSLDDLLEVESKYVNLQDPKCVNTKDPRIIGNLNAENNIRALKGEKYSTNPHAYTWFKRVDIPDIFIKCRGEWQPIRAITYNKADVNLKLFEVTYNKKGELKTLYLTEDHPLHTQRGRVETKDLTLEDKVIDCNTGEYYNIVEIKESKERYETYDFEVDNDMFDLSGIMSHNCRSFLTPWRGFDLGNIANAGNYDPNKPKYYGRFNQGVVTINLVDVACSSKRNMDKFWRIFDERLELCHKALRLRHERLKGTPSDVAPILWQDGALARLQPGETIDKLLYGGYSTISLGYAGLWEMVYYMTGKKLTEPEGEEFGLKVMQHMNDFTAKWKEAENIDYSLYGTPIESTTYKFAKCLQERFGIIEGVTDKTYITNSYHVHVTEEIDAFSKLALESKFQKLSPGGAISYIEVPNMMHNQTAVLEVIKFIYNNIMYAELNTRYDFCSNCGFEGEIQVVEDDNGKLVWECPKCHNRDQSKMNVVRRTCGYIGSSYWNQGRTSEIKNRVLHL